MPPRQPPSSLKDGSSSLTVSDNTAEPSAPTFALDSAGGPVVPPPPPASLREQIVVFIIKHLLFPILWPILISGYLLKSHQHSFTFADLKKIYQIVRHADYHSIRDNTSYQDPTLLKKVYQQPSAQHYLQRGALEYQLREGYCAGTTLRCVLKSFAGFPTHLLPTFRNGPKKPEDFCAQADQASQDDETCPITLHSEIYRATAVSDDDDDYDVSSSSYQDFVQTLQISLADDHTRVALNYLRPALFGFPHHHPLWWTPITFFFGMFAGHFSPILGIVQDNNVQDDDDDEPLVAVFDVNHKYGGTYLVPARRLYDSICCKDISTQQGRALIIVKQQQQQE